MFIRLPFKLQCVAILIFAHILAIEIFAGELAPVCNCIWPFIPPYSETSVKRCEFMTPINTGGSIMCETHIKTCSESVNITDT